MAAIPQELRALYVAYRSATNAENHRRFNSALWDWFVQIESAPSPAEGLATLGERG
jgi:hypothetical protein